MGGVGWEVAGEKWMRRGWSALSLSPPARRQGRRGRPPTNVKGEEERQAVVRRHFSHKQGRGRWLDVMGRSEEGRIPG